MTIELRVLTGARAGHRGRFDGPTITIGRHPQCDLQLDVHADLDVSSRHAELRVGSEGYVTVADLGSTNGTFVNGERITTVRLADGDVVQLGKDGPRVEVAIGGRAAAGGGAAVGGRRSAVGAAESGAGRRASGAGHARGAAPDARRPTPYLVGGLLVIGIAAAYVIGARRSADEVAELRRLVEGHDSTTRTLASRLEGMSDSAVLGTLQRANDSLRAVVQAGTATDRAEVRDEVARLRESAQRLAAVDLTQINAANAPAIAYMVTEVEGRVLAGTAFAIDASGRLLTNRHLVRNADGTLAARIAVKFRDRREWHAARVVRVAEEEHDDLALVQLASDASVPAVRGIAPDTRLAEGAPIATIGYPLGRSTMMEGDGDDFVAKTSLYPGTVSKVLPQVLQLATFAGHGASGSPVFDARGLVVGVVWGGPPDAQGRIVYAVPAERIRAFVAR